MSEIAESYYSSRRYHFMLPHVIGAILWWNLYFIQLIPSIRRKHKTFHRYMGRFLMVVAFVQMVSGVGMAFTSHSYIIKMISYVLATAAIFCLWQAFKYAYHRDIPRHKYWALRLVGYLQTNALQRFWLLVLIISHQLGFYGLFPPLDNATREEANEVVRDLFDGAFIMSILHSRGH